MKILGGGAILAATSATYLITRKPNTALQPWVLPGADEIDVIRKGLSYAILAPNPHNRQPWIVDLKESGQFTLFVDQNRLLPHTDPFSRQITIGLGCFITLFEMAMKQQGYATTYSFFPEGDAIYGKRDLPVVTAKITKSEGISPDPLFQYVLHRRSNKDPYDTTRAVSENLLQKVIDETGYFSETGGSVLPADIARFRELTHSALQIEIDTPRTYKESVDLFRIGHKEIDKNPDGIDFSGPLFETLRLAGQFSREHALDRSSVAYQSGLEAVFQNTDSAMGHIWIVTPDNTRLSQLRAGGDWLRMNLLTTQAGLSTQPLSQALQEYPEMEQEYRKIHSMIAPHGGTVQMFARIGYGIKPDPSPRWPLKNKIKKNS